MSSQGLFRPEAVDAQRRGWLGNIYLAQSLPRRLAAATAIAFAGSLVVFVCFGQYTRRERVDGQLVPDHARYDRADSLRTGYAPSDGRDAAALVLNKYDPARLFSSPLLGRLLP